MPDYIIRDAVEDDAQDIIDYLLRLTEEPDLHILMNRERALLFTVDYERDVIRRYTEAENSQFVVAVAGGQVIALLSAEGGERDYNRHRVNLGISVEKAWRGKGVGTALLNYAIDRARATGSIRRIELEVFCENENAIRLYQRLGFVIEGRRNRAFIKNGQFIDEYQMALMVD